VTLAVVVSLAGFFVALAFVLLWRLQRRHRRELSDRDASYRALLEINVRHYRDIAERDARYRHLLEEAREGVVAVVDEHLVFANPAVMKMFGLTRDEEWVGKRFFDFVAPESRPNLPAMRGERAPVSASPERYEVVALSADGSRFDMEITPAAMTYQGRAATQAILRDVTDRKRAEQALKESEESYRVLVQTAQHGIINIDAESTILFVNPATEKIFGYAAADLLGRKLTMLMPESHRHVHKMGIERYRKTGVRHLNWEALQLPGLHRNGREVPLEVSFGEVHRNGQRFFTGTVRDVTEREHALEALRQSEEKFRSIFDFATLGIYQSRRDGSLVTANATLAAMLGYDSPEELMRKNLFEIYADPEVRRTLLERYGDAEEGQGLELLWKKKDGSPIWVELHFHAVKDTGGAGHYFEGFVHDITERRNSEAEKRRLEGQLIQSQKMEAVGQLAGGIAHDFNNLLTAIAGYSELLLGELPPDDPRRSYAEEIRRAGERAANLTQQLLAFSRQQLLEPKVFDVNGVVTGIETMFRRLLGEHIELRTRKASDLWRVKADPGQIEQAVVNLAINARDAMPDGGTLMIETANAWLDDAYSQTHMPAQAGAYAMIAVSDTGIGMTPEVKARLFEPFFTTKERGKGTGLGLSTTYGIVKQSGGYIWCYSELGRGTTFKVYLPRAEDAMAEAPAPPPPAAHPGSETVLLVEDEPEVRSLVQRILKMQGYTVVTAANPDEAIAIAREFKGKIEMMVTDVVMPGMSGRQLAERLARSRPEMRVLFVSGYTDDAVVRHGVIDQGTAFLQKPFTPTVLARKVREVLDAPPDHFKNS